MTPRKNSLESFCDALKSHDQFLLSCHLMPEGDAVGSLLAVDSLLRRLGKKSTIVCEDAFPSRLSVLSSKRWNRLGDTPLSSSDFRVLLTTDCPTLTRIGKIQELITPDTVIFNIDHHVSNGFFGHFNYVKPDASACGEVVHEIFKKMQMPVTEEEATNLYVAILTDTGSFKYSNTTAACHQTAAELLSSGIDVEKINDSVYSTYSLNKIQLYSRLLSRFKTTNKGHIAWTAMRRADLTRSGATDEDAEGFIDFLKYLKEVKVAFFMMELPGTQMVRVSFRSKGGYDVNKIATYFQGGGHLKASGCLIRGTLKQAEKMILNILNKELKLERDD